MKDLTDSVKEAYSQVETPAPDGSWKVISSRMRRASAVRKAALAASAAAVCAVCFSLLAPRPVEEPVTVAEVRTAGDPVMPSTEEPLQDKPAYPRLVSLTARSAEPKPQPQSQTQTQPQQPQSHSTDAAGAGADEADPVRPGETRHTGPADAGRQATEDISPEEITSFTDRVGGKSRRLSVGLNVSPTTGSGSITYVKMPQLPFLAMAKSNNSIYENQLLNNYSYTPTSFSYVHDLPVGIGLTVSVPLSGRISIESGLEYSYQHSVEDNTGLRSDQTLHFISIPVRVGYSIFARGAFSLYAGAGATVGKCFKAEVGGVRFNETRLQWSGEAFAGAEYLIWDKAGIYFQPTMSYQFTSTDLITYRTENPLVLSLDAGLRFHF